MGWMHLIIFAQINHSEIDTRQRRTKDILNIFQKGSVFGLGDFINFKNTASHKCLVQKFKSLWMARSEITENSFLVFIQKWHRLHSVLKIPVANICRLITPQTHPAHGRCVPSWSFNCVWFVDPTSPESKSKVLLKLCMKILTTRCALEVVSLAPRVDLESKQTHAFVSEWM